MIVKLRRKITLLVVAVLILVTAGIVFSINYINWLNIEAQAESALELLAENSGERPELPSKPSEDERKSEEEKETGDDAENVKSNMIPQETVLVSYAREGDDSLDLTAAVVSDDSLDLTDDRKQTGDPDIGLNAEGSDPGDSRGNNTPGNQGGQGNQGDPGNSNRPGSGQEPNSGKGNDPAGGQNGGNTANGGPETNKAPDNGSNGNDERIETTQSAASSENTTESSNSSGNNNSNNSSNNSSNNNSNNNNNNSTEVKNNASSDNSQFSSESSASGSERQTTSKGNTASNNNGSVRDTAGETRGESNSVYGESSDDEGEGASTSGNTSSKETNSKETTGGNQISDTPETPKPEPGQPVESVNNIASLSNYYVVYLSIDGEVTKWTSDRSDLYTDEQIEDFTALALADGKDFGRIGTQFYKLTKKNGIKMLIVLDERLTIDSFESTVRTTIIIGVLACLILCIAAYFLIRFMVKPVDEAFIKQRQFVWDASHELKTPLAVISANTQVLETEVGDNEHLGYIRSEVKRTNKLVEDLLTLARMDQGTLAIDIKELDLGKTVLSVALPFESRAFEDGKEFLIDVPDGVHCRGDSEMVKQLVVILLSNALKYSDEHGRISLSVAEKGRNAEIKVSNTGEGIKEADLKKIFDRFYRVDSSRNRSVEGFGFGLSIAKNIVDVHHGKIQVESEEGGETTFTVTLPG